MKYVNYYRSFLGTILLAADDSCLTGLWFEGQTHYSRGLEDHFVEKNTPIFNLTHYWLDQYFAGKNPKIALPLHPVGTDFQKEVWNILLQIPYGTTTTYSAIAKEIAFRHNIPSMSAQAVGNAVGKNPISIIVPCHRVIGSSGNLTGYAGGIERKIKLLELEKAGVLQ